MYLKYESITQKKWLTEALLWFVVFGIMVVSSIAIDLRLSMLLACSIELGLIIITQANRKLLIPYILEKKGLIIYLISSIAIIIAFIFTFTKLDQTITKDYVNNIMQSENQPSLLDTNLPSEKKDFFPQDYSDDDEDTTMLITARTKISILFICAFFISFMVYNTEKREKEEAIKKELENERNEMELRFLRSQINPHFLFNALNNIYSMVYTNDKNAPDSILILSEMLRYVTDESKQSQILLREEIKYIENYIKFQQFSFENSLNLKFETNIESDLVYISPMLLEPFVENSFKYSGLGNSENAFLTIKLQTKDKKLYFETTNSKGIKQKKGKTEREGVGIKNVEKRLQLLYPDSHRLEITEDENVFSVKLELTIDTKKELS